jgi:hypothetical protein
MYSYQFDCYEHAVRTQEHHQEFDIINIYIHLGMQTAQQCETAVATKKVYLRLIHTLEETMCDPLLSARWRIHCFRVIKRLTPLIFELVDAEEYENIVAKITALATYFLHFQQNQAKPNTSAMSYSQMDSRKTNDSDHSKNANQHPSGNDRFSSFSDKSKRSE